jgi:C-terminal processing protease CtpA/Prc
MQKYYYKKDSVEWDTLIKAARARVENSTSCNEANQTVKWCFQQMKEQHSFIMAPAKAKVYNGNINSKNEPPSLEKLAGPMVHEQIEKNIAYLSVPWIASADEKICTAYADSLQNIIRYYDNLGIDKWIIDLRKNSGGNCWPMLAGLGPLIGNGVHGYFVSAQEKVAFSYADGSAMQGKHVRCTATDPYKTSDRKKQIVLLVSPGTCSAGEIVAIAFKGKKDVYLYGEPTAGLTTANATYKLSDGSLLVLTVGKEADRNGKICEGRIWPDKWIVADTRSGKDLVKASAVMFLQMD